jgi:hypothetical protein
MKIILIEFYKKERNTYLDMRGSSPNLGHCCCDGGGGGGY